MVLARRSIKKNSDRSWSYLSMFGCFFSKPTFHYDNFIAIDRQSGNKNMGQLDLFLMKTKLIYEKNNIRGVTKILVLCDHAWLAYVKNVKCLKTTDFTVKIWLHYSPNITLPSSKISASYGNHLEYYCFDGIYVDLSSQFIYNHAKEIYNKELNKIGNKGNYGISDKYAIVVESSKVPLISLHFKEKLVMKANQKVFCF